MLALNGLDFTVAKKSPFIPFCLGDGHLALLILVLYVLWAPENGPMARSMEVTSGVGHLIFCTVCLR